MIRILIITGVVIFGVAFVTYLVVMLTMSNEKFEEVTRNWPEGE